MKKTQIIELFKNIKKTFVSFISIAVFIALATGIFLGINWSTTTFSKMIDKTVNDGEMQNIEITYPYGFTDDFVKEIQNTKDVSFAEGYYSTEQLFRRDDFIYQARVISFTDNVNILTAIEGNLPTKKGEIAVLKHAANKLGINIGDEIVFEHDDDGSAYKLVNLLNEDLEGLQDEKPTTDGIKSLSTDSFKVTALVEIPQYICEYNVSYGVSQTASVPNDCIMLVDESSFDKDAFAGYPNVAIRNKSLDNYVSLTDEYNKKSDEFIDEIQPLATTYTEKRNNEVLDAIKNIENTITKDIDEGEKQYEDAKALLGDNEDKLEDSIRKLQELKKLLDDSQAEINAGWAEVNSNQVLVDENEERLKKAQEIYDTADELLTYFIENRIDVSVVAKDIYDYLSLYGKIFEYSLPEGEYLTLKLLDDFFTRLNAGEFDGDIELFAEELGNIIKAISESEEYAKIDDLIIILNGWGESKLEVKTLLDTLEYLDKEYTDLEVTEICNNPELLHASLSTVLTLYDKYSPIIKLYLLINNYDVTKFENFDNIIDVIRTFNNDIDNYEDNTPGLIARFKQFQIDLKTASSYDEFVSKIKELYNQEGSVFTTMAEKLQTLKNKFDIVVEASDNLFDIYKLLQEFGVIEAYENEIYQEIEQRLIEGGYKPLRDIVKEINNALDENYDYFIANTVPIIEAEIDGIIESLKGILVDCEELLDDSWDELGNAKRQLNEAINKLYDAQKEVDDGLIQYRRSLNTLNIKQDEFDKAVIDLDEGKQKIDDGKKLLLDYQDMTREIETYDNSILGRNANLSLAATLVPMKIMSKIKYTLSILFVIVGLFVCYSAISRIIFEDTKLIGTKKALGLSKKEITISYLMYAFLAVILGTILGNLIGIFVIEPIISSAMSENFVLTNKQYFFNAKESVLFFVFELVTSLVFAYLACRTTLNKRTTDLLSGYSELSIKTRFFEKWKSWKKLPLFTKTVVINFFNDKKRVFATIVGITGCCSLLVCAALLFFNIKGTYDYHLENISKFDTIVYLDTTKDNALESVKEQLDNNNIECAPVYSSSIYFKKNDGSILGSGLYAYDDNNFRNFFGVTKDGKVINELTDGLWLNSSYAETNNINVGDNISIIDNRGNEKEVVVGGIYDYYLLKVQAVMNSKTYEKTFGTDYVDNMLVFNRNDKSIKQLFNMLDGTEGFASVYDFKAEGKELYSAMENVLIIIVIVYSIISFALSFIVLLNLYTMFVSEKKKELLVMMINGYSRKDAKKYIYQDSIFLTIIGVIAGSLLGVAVGLFTIKALNVDYVALLSKINVGTFVIAGLVTAVLSLINCSIAMREISKFELTNINAQR